MVKEGFEVDIDFYPLNQSCIDVYRRDFLASAGIPLASSLASCLGVGDDFIESISLSEPTVARGETAVIHLEVPNLTGLHISEFPDEFPSELLTLGEATFTPAPDAVFESLPPDWIFTGEDVVGEVPIETSPETPADTYRFTFRVRLEGKDEPRHIPTTVTVETGSE